jgi:hypothetical protein
MFFRAIEQHDTAVKACSDKSRIKVLQNHQVLIENASARCPGLTEAFPPEA